MIIKLIPLLIVGFLLYLIYKDYKDTPAEKKKSVAIKYGVYLLIGVLLLAVVTGRIHWLGAVLAGAIGMLKIGASTFLRFLPFIRLFKQNNVFGNPKFQTKYLEVQIFIDSGAIEGKIITGEFAGRSLASLSDSDFDKLEQLTKDEDNRSYYLLKVIRQRLRGTHSTEDFSYDNVDNPSIIEAQQILGLEDEYTKKDINLAYKRLMQKLHPDRGGNDYLASRVNTAREILIKHLENK